MTDEVLTPREVLLRLNIEKQKKTIEALRQRITDLRGGLKDISSGSTCAALFCTCNKFANLRLMTDDAMAKSRDE